MINTYDSMSVTVIGDGIIATGLADGDAVTIGQNEESFSKQVGIQGDVTFSETNDKTGFATLTLKATSPAVRQYEELSRRKGENALFSFQVIDANTNGLTSGGTKCRVKKSAEKSYSGEEGTREYEIEIADYTSK
jgi:hypothetical protein